ncbi:transmembrane protein, putative (macronuclear) [Tetrahymena thermophila SB210]|uniref:Transmembrane protein, putative n=1 Tax=Tetrahymena thermophila (strain SB210) TaxID=312017 RepID=W7XBW0_TETTS|nr:transmembrane protein, putative [Tetrahymena thermophila SB210]EWS73923.1 transmembrane protein, putative [Tetrahymena thermophila SB210]|eukprot:XP_012653545.1 transmembrane protein, putative [Tetrahymena thermophila SB210]
MLICKSFFHKNKQIKKKEGRCILNKINEKSVYMEQNQSKNYKEILLNYKLIALIYCWSYEQIILIQGHMKKCGHQRAKNLDIFNFILLYFVHQIQDKVLLQKYQRFFRIKKFQIFTIYLFIYVFIYLCVNECYICHIVSLFRLISIYYFIFQSIASLFFIYLFDCLFFCLLFYLHSKSINQSNIIINNIKDSLFLLLINNIK